MSTYNNCYRECNSYPCNNADMASSSFRAIFTVEEVLGLLDTEGEDGHMDDIFFPASDEEFGMEEEEIEM